MSEKLRPCPFCGGEPSVQPAGKVRRYAIYCAGEECFGPATTAGTEIDATVQWNTRNGDAPQALQVWYGPMPESNGKSNFTAILHKGDLVDGHTIARSEYPERVRYEADRVRFLIGELPEMPDVLAYDGDKHSGYVEPQRFAAMTDEPDVKCDRCGSVGDTYRLCAGCGAPTTSPNSVVADYATTETPEPDAVREALEQARDKLIEQLGAGRYRANFAFIDAALARNDRDTEAG